MTSSRPKNGASRRRPEAIAAINSSLNEIRHYIKLIGSGDNLASRTLSVIITRIIEEELPIAVEKGPVTLVSFRPEEIRWFPLTMLEVTEHGTRITPLPTEVWANKPLPLKKWKSEIIYSPPAGGFVAPSTEAPPRALSRMDFIRYVRNEIGAHFGAEVGSHVAAYSHDFSPLQLSIVARDGEPILKPSGKEPHRWTYLSATIVTVGYEILHSVRVFMVGDKAELHFINSD